MGWIGFSHKTLLFWENSKKWSLARVFTWSRCVWATVWFLAVGLSNCCHFAFVCLRDIWRRACADIWKFIMILVFFGIIPMAISVILDCLFNLQYPLIYSWFDHIWMVCWKACEFGAKYETKSRGVCTVGATVPIWEKICFALEFLTVFWKCYMAELKVYLVSPPLVIVSCSWAYLS